MDPLLKFLNTLFPSNPILLAGSHALGNQTDDSDVDLLVFTDDVQIPVITYREMEGYKMEIVEMPKKGALYFMERTAHDSGAYIFMLSMGKIIRDQDGFLLDMKLWGEQRFLAGPSADNKYYRINRGLIDLTNLLTDLEGDKSASEKALIANEIYHNLFNILFLLHGLWPMSGKWVYRKLNPIYPDLLDRLFQELKISIGTTDYSTIIGIVDELIEPIGGRLTEYSSTTSGDQQLQTGPLQIILPGVFLAQLDRSAFEALRQLKNQYSSTYLKDFEEGGIGVVIPEISNKVTTVYSAMELVSPTGNAKFSYEPILRNLYGGVDYYVIAEEFFSLVADTVLKIPEQLSQMPDKEALLEVCAYLLPIFCSSMNIARSDVSRFSGYLMKKWIVQAADPYNEANPVKRHELAQALERKLQENAQSADEELKTLLHAILSDNTLRFDDTLYDSWADGLAKVAEKLEKQLEKHALSISKFQLLAVFNETEVPKGSALWPVFEQYLVFLFDILDVDKKDRLYIVSLINESVSVHQ
ncbi:MAG: nucleotidyltransferase domain-containing protein [Cyclobacteriaceae bacterium]